LLKGFLNKNKTINTKWAILDLIQSELGVALYFQALDLINVNSESQESLQHDIPPFY
jgi:hypothetical protein